MSSALMADVSTHWLVWLILMLLLSILTAQVRMLWLPLYMCPIPVLPVNEHCSCMQQHCSEGSIASQLNGSVILCTCTRTMANGTICGRCGDSCCDVLRGFHCRAADNVPNLAQVFDVYKTLLQEPGFLSQNGIPNATVAAEFINEVCGHSATSSSRSDKALLHQRADQE
jgi:hypothetical protein